MNKPYDEKIKINGRIYRENLPLQSAKVRPANIIDNRI